MQIRKRYRKRLTNVKYKSHKSIKSRKKIIRSKFFTESYKIPEEVFDAETEPEPEPENEEMDIEICNTNNIIDKLKNLKF